MEKPGKWLHLQTSHTLEARFGSLAAYLILQDRSHLFICWLKILISSSETSQVPSEAALLKLRKYFPLLWINGQK